MVIRLEKHSEFHTLTILNLEIGYNLEICMVFLLHVPFFEGETDVDMCDSLDSGDQYSTCITVGVVTSPIEIM